MPEIKILGDSPTTEDGLGFDPYVDLLLKAINNFDDESSLTIGIHGSWGSGKTSLMKMLEEKFEHDKSVETIWFNAWAHGREEPIELALLQQVLSSFKGIKIKFKFIKVSKSLSKLFADAALRKTTGITLEQAKKIFKDSIEIKSTLKDDFKTAINKCLKKKKLVVFIDDLDRCLPERTIEILEAIKLFLDVPRCVFVIGVEKEMIERGIKVRYKTGGRIPISGKDYIEKIIQVPFRLPPIREEVMIGFIESLGISKKERGYTEIVAKGTGCNPRKVKMFLNTLGIRQAIADKSGGELKPAVAAKLFVIEYTFPEFYKDVVKFRGFFLCKLEKYTIGGADEKLRKELEASEILEKYLKNEALRSVLKDAPSLCEINIEPYIYLSGIKAPEVFDESVLNELSSRDSVRVEHAANTIKKMPESEKQRYLEILIPKLKDKESMCRWQAAMALGIIGDDKAVEPLIGVLKDKEAVVRSSAATALGKIGNVKAVEPLIVALKDKEADVRSGAAVALGIGDAKAVGPLTEAAQKDENEAVREDAKKALQKIKAKQNSK